MKSPTRVINLKFLAWLNINMPHKILRIKKTHKQLVVANASDEAQRAEKY